MHVGLNYIYPFHFLPVPLSPAVSRRGLVKGLGQAGDLVCGSRQRHISPAGLQHRLRGPSWVWQLSRLLMSCPQREGERGSRFADSPTGIDFLHFSHAPPGFSALAQQLWVVPVAGGTGANSWCVCGASWRLPCSSHGVSSYRWSGSVGCHCTVPWDEVVWCRNGRVVPHVGCFFCYLVYFRAITPDFQS